MDAVCGFIFLGCIAAFLFAFWCMLQEGDMDAKDKVLRSCRVTGEGIPGFDKACADDSEVWWRAKAALDPEVKAFLARHGIECMDFVEGVQRSKGFLVMGDESDEPLRGGV